MQHSLQVTLAKEVLSHLDARTTCLAEDTFAHPVAAYTSAERLAREKAVLFRQYPLLVGLSCRLRHPGDYLTDDDSGVPILVVRDASGELRAFVNVCRHRGSKVARGSGCIERNFVCPYHGWTYDTSGRLVGIPDARSFEGIDRDAHGLVPLPVAEKHGLIWVKPTPGGKFSVDEYLAGLGAELGSYGFERYHHYEGRVLRHAMNWKIVIDTFLEPYHFSVLHTNTVAPIFFPNLCLFHPFGMHLRETLPRRSIVELRDQPESEWNLIKHTALVYVLFPNTVFVMQADHAEVWRVFPAEDRVDRSVAYLDFYIPEPADSDSARRHWERNMDLTIRTVEEEDFPIGESIQQGFAAGIQDHVTHGRNEPALQHWQRSIAAALE